MNKEKDNLVYLPAIISLSAGLIISIVMLVNKRDSLTSLIAVFAFLLGFYIVGLIFKFILQAVATKVEIEEEEQLENVDTEENQEDNNEV